MHSACSVGFESARMASAAILLPVTVAVRTRRVETIWRGDALLNIEFFITTSVIVCFGF